MARLAGCGSMLPSSDAQQCHGLRVQQAQALTPAKLEVHIYDEYAEYGPGAILHIRNEITYFLSYFCHILHIILHILLHILPTLVYVAYAEYGPGAILVFPCFSM